MEIPSGRVLDWTYSFILTHRLGVREFQITQQTLREIEIQVVVTDSFEEATESRLLASKFKETFGTTFDATVLIVPAISRSSSGKYNPIRSFI